MSKGFWAELHGEHGTRGSMVLEQRAEPRVGGAGCEGLRAKRNCRTGCSLEQGGRDGVGSWRWVGCGI